MSQLYLIMIMSYYVLLSDLIFTYLWARELVPLVRNHRDVRVYDVPNDSEIITELNASLSEDLYIYIFSLAEPELLPSQRLERHSTKIILISSS